MFCYFHQIFSGLFNEEEEDRLFHTITQITETANIAKKLKMAVVGRAGTYYV